MTLTEELFDLPGNAICFHGFSFDTILDITEQFRSLSAAFVSTCIAAEDRNLEPGQDASPYGGHTGQHLALVQTFTANCYLAQSDPEFGDTRKPSEAELLSEYEVAVNRALPRSYKEFGEDSIKHFNKGFRLAVMRHMQNRRLFTSTMGYFSACPVNACVGDRIVIFPGLPAPFLMRRRPSSTTESYQLVGASYVHGIMEGEFIEQLKHRYDIGSHEDFLRALRGVGQHNLPLEKFVVD